MNIEKIIKHLEAHPTVQIGRGYYKSEMIVEVIRELQTKAVMVRMGIDSKDRTSSLMVEILMAEFGDDGD